MTTHWSEGDVCDLFEAYDDLPERVLGYPFVFDALELDRAENVLDYGCGPGKVARRVVDRCGARVLAVDRSPRMLEIATSKRAHERIEYRLLDGQGIPGAPDESIDAAMCCYVFINVPSLDTIRAIAAEVRRVVRPGGRFAVLDTNPDTTGVQFSTFRSGEPGRRYATGEQREVVLTTPEGELVLLDYHWPKEVYVDVLTGAGFRSVETIEPRLDDALRRGVAEAPERSWDAERERPPFAVFVART
ncbi:MAG TPA: methyltransferase domain-containing protein [Actinomycetota bacterium]|nr:methyltransferase domain-containing protein [Actinomycetota bacterium]